MKKILGLSLVLVIFLTTMSTYAIDGKGDYILNIKTGNGKVVSFTLNEEQKSNFSIFDNESHLIYKGIATNELETSKTLSLEAYPAGTYYLELQDNTKKVKHEIVVKSSKVNKTADESYNQSPAFRR
ncbi:T9SS type A sorting domain-containing protein [Flavobacterium sp. LS1R47]|uniref:T9SS type A sorting domain-containing protein n=1 Tax=Flavobacterium frigoritolerans TaxID=2987686 RepID=A0A9X2ZLL3_9FLAO|nr:T9SS type A sorting domain-containing protein [Flavobacterium frigoritolerans]MCV9930801.1 T9SS type A sorting domain-containing protein [Flavobacterium frigoritolerans]